MGVRNNGKKKTTSIGGGPHKVRSIWIGVERNHTVLLLYVYVFILSSDYNESLSKLLKKS